MPDLKLKIPCSFRVRSKSVHDALCALSDRHGADGWDPLELRCQRCGTEWEHQGASDFREAVCSNCYSERVVVTSIKALFQDWGDHNGGAVEQRQRFEGAKALVGEPAGQGGEG